MKNTLPVVIGLVLGAMCQGAVAESETRRVDVRLSVPSDATAEEIYGEINQAAVRACRTNPVYAHGRLARERACRQEFIARAVVEVDREALTALHLDQTGQSMADLADASGGGRTETGFDAHDK